MVSQLSTALRPVVTVTLKGPGLMEGPTAEGNTDRSTQLTDMLHPAPAQVLSFQTEGW